MATIVLMQQIAKTVTPFAQALGTIKTYRSCCFPDVVEKAHGCKNDACQNHSWSVPSKEAKHSTFPWWWTSPRDGLAVQSFSVD